MGLRELELIDIDKEEEAARRNGKRKMRHDGQNLSLGEREQLRTPAWEEAWREEGPEEEWEEAWREEDPEEEWEEAWQEEDPEEAAVMRPAAIKRRTAKSVDIQQEKKRRRKKRRRRARVIRGIIMGFMMAMTSVFFLGVAWFAVNVYQKTTKEEEIQAVSTKAVQEIGNQDIREWGKFYALDLERPELAVDLLTVNEYSRPGEELPEVKNIFIHYTANAGTTAEQNRSYFESLSESHERSASAHFVIGYDGVVVQCIPTKEIAYAVKGRNYDSISIECCYLDENGKFEEKTYDALIELTAWLLHKYELRPENVLRHYDEGGKNCPKYFVEHENAWHKFLMDLENYMTRLTDENG